jgi:hypothetical protein
MLAALALPLPPATAWAQHEHGESASPPPASGTAWLPGAAPQRGYHTTLGSWAVMVHGSVFVQFVRAFGTRGDYQLGSVNWFMADARRPLAAGTVGVRLMASAEVLTVTERGYPQLLQVAEPYRGETLNDRMHPHELLSEAAVTYERGVAGNLRASLYLAAVGEPALGPVAYMHRPSAADEPAAPLGHHAEDGAHTTFGVATFGLFTRRARFEGSVFNGAHPDDVRTNLDYAGARLNSYAARLTVNPSAQWSVAGSAGYIAASGGSHAHGALHRYGLALLHSAPRGGGGGTWSTALIWGANVPTDTRRVLHALLLESDFELDRQNVIFGRVEYVRRTAQDLALVGSVSPELDVGAVSLGYVREVWSVGRTSARLGLQGKAHLIPEELRLFYGSRTPLALTAYLQILPPLVMASLGR